MISQGIFSRSIRTTADRSAKAGAAGGPARHVPVMLREVLSFLAPKPKALYLDATFGAGGYSRALIEAGARVIGLDRDPNAILGGADLVEEAGGRLTLIESRFSALDEVARDLGALDGIVLDLGVSSMQIDEAERGFSFRADGPLDMRMESRGVSAADVVNTYAEKELKIGRASCRERV